MATKYVWRFNDKVYETRDAVLDAIAEEVNGRIYNRTSEFEEWVNDTYGSIDIGCNTYYAYDIANDAGDIWDLEDDYRDYLYDEETEQEEVDFVYEFNGERYETREEAELAVVDYANGGAYRDQLDSDGVVRIGYNYETTRAFSRADVLFKMDEAAYWEGFAAFCEDLKSCIEEVEV